MKTEMVLVRHGETDFNKALIIQGWAQSQLNDTGIRQAEATAKYLQNETFDEVFYSDLDRTTDTAKAIMKYHPDTPAYPCKDLREWHLGVLQNRPHSKVRVEEPELYVHLTTESMDNEIPGGERRSEFQSRVNRIFLELAERSPGKKLLLVTHGGVLTRFYYSQTGKSYGQIPEVRNASICRVSYDHEEKKWEILEWGTPCPIDSLKSDLSNPAL